MSVRVQYLSSNGSFHCMTGIRKSIKKKKVKSARICNEFLRVPTLFCMTLQRTTSTAEVLKEELKFGYIFSGNKIAVEKTPSNKFHVEETNGLLERQNQLTL